MKHLSILFAFAVLFSCDTKGPEGYTFEGRLAGADTGWVYLKKLDLKKQ